MITLKKAIRFDHWPNGPLRRFVVNSFIAWSMLGLYMLIDHHQFRPPTIVPMPSWVPFWPAFFIPYLLMLLTTWLLPVAIRDPALFRAYLCANICGFLLVLPWWIITPTLLPRPPLPDGAWANAVQLIWSVDAPYNVMPCAHCIGPLAAVWFAAQDRPAWRWPLVALLLVGLASIALTWQHRPVDILLGELAAVIGIVVAEVKIKRQPAIASKNPAAIAD